MDLQYFNRSLENGTSSQSSLSLSVSLSVSLQTTILGVLCLCPPPPPQHTPYSICTGTEIQIQICFQNLSRQKGRQKLRGGRDGGREKGVDGGRQRVRERVRQRQSDRDRETDSAQVCPEYRHYNQSTRPDDKDTLIANSHTTTTKSEQIAKYQVRLTGNESGPRRINSMAITSSSNTPVPTAQRPSAPADSTGNTGCTYGSVLNEDPPVWMELAGKTRQRNTEPSMEEAIKSLQTEVG